jgi:signal transduction histidine kinase
MNKRVLYILIASICISLIGIIAVQFFWIRNAFQVKEVQFARSVNDALGSVVSNIETRENMHFISRNFEGDSIMRIVQAISKDTSSAIKNRLDSLLSINDLPVTMHAPPLLPPPHPVYPGGARQPTSVIHYSYQYNVLPILSGQDSMTLRMEEFYQEMQGMQPGQLNFDWDDQLARLDSMMYFNPAEDENMTSEEPAFTQTPGEDELIIQTPGIAGPQYFRYKMQQFDNQAPSKPQRQGSHKKLLERENNIQKLDNRAKKVQDVIKQITIALETKPAPIQQRINKKSLQAALSKSLKEKGIELPFEFAVVSPSSDSNHIPIRSADFKREYESSGHRVSLFPNDLFQKPDMLLVFFPGQKGHVLKSISLLMVASILFTLIIILSSGGSIIVMIRQKKISDIKTDFINNMTHEFKTPIATISIAADSITNPRVISEPDTIKNFTRIIKEENNRMNTRVEQVLQMALLDSRDFKLRPGVIDMHLLIEKVVEHYRLQVEKREGAIISRLEAERYQVYADEDHIRNVLINLLDNANKYSVSKPEIEVFSFNRSGKFFFGVHDRGIGMSQEVQRKVFDKFYRVTSGNIHDIKGFGLGLSYVKAIVLAHQGEIHMESEPGKGSRFEISLPGLQPTHIPVSEVKQT